MIQPEEIYSILLDKYPEHELQQRVEKKRKEFRDSIGTAGILYILAREEGIQVGEMPQQWTMSDYGHAMGGMDEIDLGEFTLPIEKIEDGMGTTVIVGRIAEIYPVRNFTRKDGTPGVVGSFKVKDGTGEIKVVVWGEKVKILRSEFFALDTVVRVIADYTRFNDNERFGGLEMHLGKKGDIQLDPQDLDEDRIPEHIHTSEQKLQQSAPNGSPIPISEARKERGYFNGSIAGEILGHPAFKKIEKQKTGETYHLLQCILSDDSSAITVNIWGEHARKLKEVLTPNLGIRLTNLRIQRNSYTQDVEATLIRTSRLTFL